MLIGVWCVYLSAISILLLSLQACLPEPMLVPMKCWSHLHMAKTAKQGLELEAAL